MVDRQSFAGGINAPGISADVFARPPGLTIRYDRPAPDLADYITGYHIYSADGPRAIGQINWFLPGTANVCIALDAAPFSVQIGRQCFDPVPDVSLFGPTSQALKAMTNGGVLIGLGVNALGWSRLFDGTAAAFRDRIVPLRQAIEGNFADDLRSAVRETHRADMVAPLLDRFLRARLAPVHRDEALIRRLMQLIAADRRDDIIAIAEDLGVAGPVLRRLAVRHFGFPPKLLLRRARFLASLIRICRSDKTVDYTLIDDRYFDLSHFLRDAKAFLGTTPRRFMALNIPFLDASLGARKAALRAPMQALHDSDMGRAYVASAGALADATITRQRGYPSDGS